MGSKEPEIYPLYPTSTQCAELVGLIDRIEHSPGYIYINKADLPDVIPAKLEDKFTSGLLMTSTGGDGTTYALLNSYRKDHSDMDQHPLCFVASSTGDIKFAFLIDHAAHAGRTQKIPDGFLESYSSTMSLVGGCLSTVPTGLSSTGPLSDLFGTSNAKAFDAGMIQMGAKLSTMGQG
jgi:hypothetical protein